MHITSEKIESFRKDLRVGEIIYSPRYSGNAVTGENGDRTVKIVAKYDNFVLVTNGKYCWGITYIDLILQQSRLERIISSNSREE